MHTVIVNKTLMRYCVTVMLSLGCIVSCNTSNENTLKSILDKIGGNYTVISDGSDSTAPFEKKDLAWHLQAKDNHIVVPDYMVLSDHSDLLFAVDCISSILNIPKEHIDSNQVYKSTFGDKDTMQSLYFLTNSSSNNVYVYLFRN
ncbi:MAG: hypothetical protein WGN25_11325 [Candidatus Electrothrix sp. GW3-4]|uniref:hypothetical protein n=1 Tax=Candidatus Electrothrix sp. GW3-4 TaxID=3126740 RepID=UPI0030CDBEF1